MQKILIVEDDLAIQALLHDFIQEAGYSVELASDGVEALSRFSEQNFDLVLLDIMLPKIDGYGVCEVIRQKSNVPIIMTLDLDGYKVYSSEGNIELTPREFEILRELLNHKGRILTRQNFLQTLWKYEFFGDERIIDTHIKNLRKKLGTVDYIETIRGVGYRIDKEDKE